MSVASQAAVRLEPRSAASSALPSPSPSPAVEEAAAWARPVELATAHALLWLTTACAVGLLMAVLLLLPGLGTAFGPLTYGRWAPLHLNLALYGWTALPLIALLFRAYLPRRGEEMSRAASAAVQVWSACLVTGAAAWLLGQTSGKLFLDWTAAARTVFLGGQLALAGVLAAGLVRRLHTEPRRPAHAALAVFWAALLLVPASLAVATSPAGYPPVNPATGGPTGASLLGSTLGVVAIVLLTPVLLGLRRDGGTGAALEAWGALAVHGSFCVLILHGDRSHREPLQIAAVASLLVWAWLVPRWLGRFAWPAGAHRWLFAFLAWGALLLATAVPMFLPGLLDRIKFTDVLVGHAHLAMAGMASAFTALLLTVANQGTRLRGVLDDGLSFVLWNAGNALQVAVLALAGSVEAGDPGAAFRGEPAITTLYALRAAAGLAMLAAASRWTSRAVRSGAA